jgi:CubicO group peptidase (beta-lactamase class C family)
VSAPSEIDPWMWRRHRDLMADPMAPAASVTEPTEVVPSDSSTVLPEAPGALPATVRAELDATVARTASSALVVLHDGVLLHEWYADGVDRGSLLPSQSMHKSLLGVVVLACVAEGAIPGLDTPASTWLHEWADDERSAITVRHLLEMTSGLAQHGMSMNPLSRSFQWLFGDDTTAHVLDFPAASHAGLAFEYNNLNSQALGVLVERATGERYAALLSGILWGPLGAAPATVWLDRPGGQAATSCCLSARAYDWALFGEVVRTRGLVGDQLVIGAPLVDALCTPSAASPNYARHIWLGDGLSDLGPRSPIGGTGGAEPFDESGVILACGFGGQRVYVGRDSGVVIVRMGPPTGTPAFAQYWDNTVLLNTVTRALG